MEHTSLRSLLVTSELPRLKNRKTIEDSVPLSAPESPLPAPELLISKAAIEARLLPETRQTMRELLAAPPTAAFLPFTPSLGAVPAAQMATLPSQLNPLLPAFLALKGQILLELENNLGRLLTLNLSRREAIAQYLDRLACLTPGPATVAGNIDSAAGLRRWIEGPRSPAQNVALQAYFEELALILLGQSLLLKAWSDRGLRAWGENDLKDLNWAMNSALKPHIPLDRENWQIARQNIYSWYKPSPALQRDVWNTLESWRIASEGPGFLGGLFASSKKIHAEHSDPQGYDFRFFKAIWDSIALFGFDPTASLGPIRRNWTIFSPTLRDGSMVRGGPVSLSWIGLESSPFQLMLCELMQLWWGMAPPPLWSIGKGLEVHTRDQLSLNLGSPKPSLISRIAEMEACDAAFVLEERAVRAQGRTAEAQRFREQVESIPYFRKLRQSGTTLGALQACVSLSKLRPGGLLWWAREEPLDQREGAEVLNFLLERGRLACEWDFTGVEHALPAPRALFPRHLYLFCREPKVEARLGHRPLRLTVRGQIRSHVELPTFLDDAFQAGRRPVASRGNWQIHAQQSPTPQKDWVDHWPDPACQSTVRLLERLRENSLPLASATTIRQTPDGDPARNDGWCVDLSLKGFWIQAQSGAKAGADGRRLVALPLPRPGKEAQGQGFLILVADENSAAPLKHYLESDLVSQWLEHNCERRGDRWIITEQVARWIPVPKPLLQSLGLSPSADPRVAGQAGSGFALPLPGEWERLSSQLAHEPGPVKDAVFKLLENELESPRTVQILTEIFVRASRTLEHVRSSHHPLLNMIAPEGKIRWRELLGVLPKTECVAISLHPTVTVSGNLPLHLPIGQIAPIKTPRPGILFATEVGLSLRILTDSSLILDMLWDQIEGLTSPTWSELMQYLKLPRRLELAESTACDLLRAHGDQTRRLADLVELISACKLF